MNNEKNLQSDFFESNFVLFDLKLKAANIKSCYGLKNSLMSLVNFVETNRLRFINP